MSLRESTRRPAVPLEAAGVFFLGALWLIYRPYMGIYHDARMYVFQALRHLEPDQFGSDLYFRYGSQDAYTFLSTIHATLAASLGLDRSTIVLVIASQALFLTGLWVLSRVLMGDDWSRWVFLYAVAILPAFYVNLQLSYGESFLSARPSAEALVLLSLAALLVGRIQIWAGASIVAAAFHPVIAATGLWVGCCYLVLKDWRWIGLPLGGGSFVLCLAALGHDPFTGLLEWFDSDWAYLTTLFPNVAFIRTLDSAHWFSVLWSTAVIIVGAQYCQSRERRLLAAVAVATAIGYLVTLLGADLLGNVLLTQLQLLRVLWLFQLLAYLALARLVQEAIRQGEDGVMALACLLTARVIPLVPLALVLLGIFLGMWMIVTSSRRLPAWARIVGWLPLPLWAAAGCWASQITEIQSPTIEALSYKGADFHMIALIFLSPSLLAILLASLLLVRCYRTPPQAGRLGLALAGVAALLVAAVTWDQRSPPLRDAERRYGQEHLLSDKVGPALDVYWDDRHLLHLWFLAGTPSYTSLVQGSGLIYSREKAMEWKRRMSVVRNLKPDEPFTIEAAPPISATDVNRVCRDPELDYVVLTSQTDGRDSISFRWQGRQYFLADCRTRR